MQKLFFHNYKSIDESKDKIKPLHFSNIEKKSIVDINTLLNRVKIEKKNEIKKKIIFFTLITLALFFFGIFILSIK
tara:strand:- start:301 stop:528 length:228 start_codon:yes stop_codon:yes gene_type:complete